MTDGPETRHAGCSFPLDRMDPLNLSLSIVVLAIPGVILIVTVVLFFASIGSRNPLPGLVAAAIACAVGVLIGLLYLFIWLALRPSRFELSGAGLRIVWPLRSKTIPMSEIRGAETLLRAEFRKRYGLGMRVGAGGLGGGFGLAVMSSGPSLEMYISRIDRMVIVHTKGSRSLLITPRDPDRFVAAIAGLAGHSLPPNP